MCRHHSVGDVGFNVCSRRIFVGRAVGDTARREPNSGCGCTHSF